MKRAIGAKQILGFYGRNLSGKQVTKDGNLRLL
jgi:hypothetical protein